MQLTPQRIARVACAAGLSLTIALGGAPGMAPTPAYAASAQTLSELSRLQGQVSDATAIYTDAMARAEKLNGQVRDLADEILEIEQERMPELQRRASDAASNLYKMHAGAGGMLSLLLNAGSFDDLLAMNKYLGTIKDENLAALAELQKLEDDLTAKLEKLNAAKTQADAELDRAGAALSQAKGAAAEMQRKANAEDAAEREAARKAAEEAAKLEQQHQQATGGAAADKPQNGSTGSSGDSGTDDAGDKHETPAKPQAGGWKSGVASHYGIGDGFMGGTTASGDIVTETSMGVAMLNVPLGTRVEIRYGGRSVIAVVNDRGPYAHGRVIDMQPAVARALNFVDVGVGTVQYRFL